MKGTCPLAELEARALSGSGVPGCVCPDPAAHEAEVARAGRGRDAAGLWPVLAVLAVAVLAARRVWAGRTRPARWAAGRSSPARRRG